MDAQGGLLVHPPAAALYTNHHELQPGGRRAVQPLEAEVREHVEGNNIEDWWGQRYK